VRGVGQGVCYLHQQQIVGEGFIETAEVLEDVGEPG
jgi:hypothetical protein